MILADYNSTEENIEENKLSVLFGHINIFIKFDDVIKISENSSTTSGEFQVKIPILDDHYFQPKGTIKI